MKLYREKRDYKHGFLFVEMNHNSRTVVPTKSDSDVILCLQLLS